MKRIALALYVMGMGFAVMAQSTPAGPLATTSPDNTRYLADPSLLADCQARLEQFNGKPCDLIFIGDSITAGWLGPGKAIWDAKYAPRRAFNFGIGGDTTQNVLWRLDNMSLQDIKPKVAVILIGTNNIANTPHEIADGVKAILANTQSAFPGVKIILVSIMPTRREREKMMQADSLLRSLADGETIYYLNLVPLMPATPASPDGKTETNYKGLGSDGLHPDASGYQIWADAMEPLLTKLLGGGP